jgi:hypothetical protein
MRTTVRLDDALLNRARREAARRGVTLTSLIDRGLRAVLQRPAATQSRTRIRLPVSRAGGGVLPGVNLDDSAGLLERMDSES